MKEIVAIIRMNMMNKTKDALLDIGVPAFFAVEVLGRGKGLSASPLATEGPLEATLRTTENKLEKGRLFVGDRPNESTECSANGATECSHNGAIW